MSTFRITAIATLIACNLATLTWAQGPAQGQQGPPPVDASPAPGQPQYPAAPPQYPSAPPQSPAPQPAPLPQGEITMQTFYDQLAPYGQWINYPGIGYVFAPSVAPGFQPYATAGRWTFNEQFGWTWASDYPWGWACFHYGRWNYDWQYGWLWVPDLNWGPAWVAWRNAGEYYGWAPLPFGATLGIGFAGDFNIRPEHWSFVPRERICDFYLSYYFLPRVHNLAYIQHSYIINRMDFGPDRRVSFFLGPDRREVERFVASPIRVIGIEQVRPVYEARRFSQPAPVHEVVHENVVREEQHPREIQMRESHVQARPAEPMHHIEIHQMPTRGNR